MELRRLRYFLRIAAEGSLGKASRSLGVAQPALGRHVQMLEAELGVKLFRRVSKGMQLTDEGEYLKEALDHPIEQVHTALRNVRSYATRVEASLVLGLPSEVAVVLGAHLIRRLRADLPNLSLKIVEGDSAKLAADLARGLDDIAVLVAITPVEKIFHFEVVRELMTLVAPPDSEMADRVFLSFSDLRELPLILPGAQTGLRTKLEKLGLAAGFDLSVPIEIDSTELTKQAVRDGQGFAILPPLVYLSEAQRGELIGIPIVDPGIDQLVHCAIRPRWPVSRTTFDIIELAILSEWQSTVSSGGWPAEWLFDMNQTHSPRDRKAS